MVAPLVALALDLALGEPPAALHPTAWMGRWLARSRRSAPVRPPGRALAAGAAAVAGGTALTALAAWLVSRALSRAPAPIGLVLHGIALKPALALRALLEASVAVECSLRQGRLRRARRLLGRHLVSRETRELSPTEVVGATIESLAENTSDGIIAPLLAYRVGGLPAAYAYRFINTADAMLGYRTPALEHLGKVAARSDDGANLVPARLTALAIAAAAPLGGGSPGAALRCVRRDARRTASPNAGWPMAAMAGALGCRLTKRDGTELLYVLNARGRAPGVEDLVRARRIVIAATLLVAGVLAW